MKKTLNYTVAAFPLLLFSGCAAVGEKAASLSIIYAATALSALLLLIGCCMLVRKNRMWFILLFSSVSVVNIGYTLLAVSTGLKMALWANRISYLGSVLLPLAMLMILLSVTVTPHPKWLHAVLGIFALLVFLIAASPGILPIYYKEVSFAVVDGISTLQKVYGPLHPLYLFYLLGYFSAMVAVIIRARAKKTIDTTAHATILIIAVFVNIGVWLIEQLTRIDFEMLSISYIISELFLLGAHLVMSENQRLHALINQVETARRLTRDTPSVPEQPVQQFEPERLELFSDGIERLTATERAIYEAHLSRTTTREILESFHITENTLKYHNKNLYSKLGVSSKKELLEIYKYLKSLSK